MKSKEIILTNLKEINLDEGNVLHGLKKSDSSYKGFLSSNDSQIASISNKVSNAFWLSPLAE